jgi:hypothetical protein
MDFQKSLDHIQVFLETLYGLSRPVSRKLFVIFIISLSLSFSFLEIFIYREDSIIFGNISNIFKKDFTFGLLTLPFLFSALSLSIRRLADAGASPWLGFLALAPGINLILFLALALAPSNINSNWHYVSHIPTKESDPDWTKKRAWTLVGLIVVSTIIIVCQLLFIKKYSAVLFVTIPFTIGVLIGYIKNDITGSTSLSETFGTIITVIASIGLLLLIFRAGGIICLIMAIPISLPFIFLGAAYGRAVTIRWWPLKKSHLLILFLLIPIHSMMGIPYEKATLVEIKTAQVIQASPEKVWKFVPQISRLPKPDEWMFKLGIAYPTQASLKGVGVGAKRFCEFSTGTIEETITVWEKDQRLTFDVNSQPSMMVKTTWGPSILSPELRNFIKSKRGEFRLILLPDGSTRLEGSSWLSVDIHPFGYWRLILEPIVHSIHKRVFRQIKQQAESDKSLSTVEQIPLQVARN